MPPWDRRRGFQRNVEGRGSPKSIILIVCEGEKTEPNYFQGFTVTSAILKVDGAAKNTDTLVEHAIGQKAKICLNEGDQVWCVFDRDSFSAHQFNRALQLAESNGVKVAYSNEAFELWYLLHFNYYDTGMSRHQYKDKLSTLLSFEYLKNSKDMYNLLKDRQGVAIRNAARLLASRGERDPFNKNPITKVHLLVEELNKWR